MTSIRSRVRGGDITTMREGWTYFPPKSEVPTYDEDGNLTGDGRWQYGWDGENRLVAMEERADVARPVELLRQRLEFTYDSQSRRVRKVVKEWEPGTDGGGTWVLRSDTRFLYDGWNVIAEFESSTGVPLALKATYAWGLDLSGTETGAGGVGGLLLVKLHSTNVNNSSTTVHPPSTSVLAPCYDGNGNILAYVDCATGQTLARYEYDPFGKLLLKDEDSRLAGRLHHQFSTKYTDNETGLSYYGYRYYAPELGRWMNRDPIEEVGGLNLYLIAGNDLLARWDKLGQFDATYSTPNGAMPGGASGMSIPCVDAFLVGFERKQEGYYTDKQNHCITSCELKKACGETTALIVGAIKEARDMLMGYGAAIGDSMVGGAYSWVLEKLGQQGHDFDAAVEDAQANLTGLECAVNDDCEKACGVYYP